MGQVTQNNDLYTWTIPVKNNGGFNSTENVVTDPLPDGIKYLNAYTIPANVGTITYNTGTKTVTWDIGLLTVGQEVTLKINTKIIDVTEAPFVNEASIEGSLIDPDEDNNTFTETVTVTTCAPVSGAVSDFDGCLCGDVSINDTACSHGTTEYRLQIGSLVNLDAGFTLNTDGTYSAMGMIIDLFEEASFQYSIYCIVGEDEYQTSGPVIQVINPLFNALQNFPSSANINKKFIIPSSVFTIAYGAAGEIVKDDAAKVWALDSLNIPVSDRPGAILVYDRPSNPGNGMTYEYNWIIAYDSSMTLTIVRIKDPVINYYTEVPLLINLTPGSTGNTLDLTTAHVSTCPGTTSWVVNTNSWIINKVIVGDTLTYDVHADAASGEYNFEIIPTCIIP
jgi:uncharacterized repeat protein (TIGR01451 family)